MPRTVPYQFTEAIADEICDRLINGESLRAICRDDGKPSPALVCRCLTDEDKAAFREQYDRAREAQADTLADEILDIADNPVDGEETTEKADGAIETRRGDMIAHRRLQVDSRKWIASKLKPKKYGDRQAIDLALSADIAICDALLKIAEK